MSSDAPSERHKPMIRRKPDKWAREIIARGKPKSLSRVVADNYLDMKELRSAFRPPEPDSLKERIRKMLHPPYIPFTSVLLAALSFTLVLSYAESWSRSQSRIIPPQQAPGPSQQAPGMAERSGVTGESVAYQNGATPRIKPAVFKKDGTLYHVLTGPFPSRSLAEKTCAEFTAAKQDCLVIKR